MYEAVNLCDRYFKAMLYRVALFEITYLFNVTVQYKIFVLFQNNIFLTLVYIMIFSTI